jgi:hypothetical protein
MAIVLVIIGIILGMVIKGRELVESARTKSFISNLRSMESMQFAFYDRFNRFAGDCDNDGLVDNDDTARALTDFDNDPTGLCADTTASNDIDTSFSELESMGLLADIANTTHSNFGNGFGFAYFANVGSRNVLVLRNIPCYAAVALDAALDRDVDGATGRVRNSGNRTWTTEEAECDANLREGTVETALYYFDRAP